jgi:hypothetical protein
MLYVLRLSGGDCVVTAAEDAISARGMASSLGLESGETVVSVRPLDAFAVRLSPNLDGSLDVSSWDVSTINNLLAHEYPLLNAALREANSVRFMPPPEADRPVLDQLKEAYEQNSEIIRRGLQLELQRSKSETFVERRKTARK